MKQIFTLITVIFMLSANSSSAQINEHFENGFAPLQANCWEFFQMSAASNPSSYVINQNASLYCEPPVNQGVNRTITTPYFIATNSITISFIYKLSEELRAQQTRTVILELINNINEVVQPLTSFNIANTATTPTTFNQTFPINADGIYRLRITFAGGTGGGNARVSFDDLFVSSEVFGCLSFVMPVKLTNFQGSRNGSQSSLKWSVADNKTVNRFEVERSFNGKDFQTAALVLSSEKTGTEEYFYKETFESNLIYYRLKMFDNNQMVTYSKIVAFQTNTTSTNSTIKILNNPSTDKLTLTFASTTNKTVQIKLYDLAGRLQLNERLTATSGNNYASFGLSSSMTAGMYIVELNDGAERQTAKFIKQ